MINAKAKLNLILRALPLLAMLITSTPAAAMCYGVGDRYWWHIAGEDYKTTPQLLSWLGFPANNRLLGIWLTQHWQPGWIHGLQVAIDAGYVPVLFDYTLGDLYQDGPQPWHYVEAHQQAFMASVQRLAATLRPLHGTILVVLQPEFNIPGVQDQPGFGRLLAKAATLLHDAQHPGLHIRVGTCVGDFGHYGTRAEDPQEWSRFSPALTKALPHLDFLAFQEMRGGTHRNRQKEMKSYTPDAEGIAVLGKRTVAFSAYLQAHYRKPLLLAYFVVATMSPPGESPRVWESAAAHGYTDLLQDSQKLAKNGVFGVMAMSLFNDMAHNNDEHDFWGNAADHFGLVRANAPLGKDHIGEPPYQIKAAGRAWIAGTKNPSTDSCPPSSLDQCCDPRPAK
ncbi:hypothetical protein [Acidithiobacillus sulfuriphilus]|uniref:hypothetical protein n=1 Tax=Acidithiobacillus sulfuriphilus TaxID=1867749 RepID=UPI003F5F2F6A